MALVQLHNEDWGYETNCFVCEPTNSAGLRIPFFHDAETSHVVAEFTLGHDFTGAPGIVHGGVTLAVIDEAMAWACIAIGHRWAMTTQTSTRFVRPLQADSMYRVTARIAVQTETTIEAAAQVLFDKADGQSTLCADTQATFAILGEAQVQRITGAAQVDRSYVKD